MSTAPPRRRDAALAVHALVVGADRPRRARRSSLVVALLGPYFAPHSPSAIVGVAVHDAEPALLLGTDYLGRDVLSRVALRRPHACSRTALLATLLAYVVGARDRPGRRLQPRLARRRADARRWTCCSRSRRCSSCSCSRPASARAPATLVLGDRGRARARRSRASCAPPRSRLGARLRRGGDGARRASAAILRREILPNIAAHDRRRRRAALHGLDPARRRRQLPRARARAAGRRLGADDLARTGRASRSTPGRSSRRR